MGSSTGPAPGGLKDFCWEAPWPWSCLLRWAALLALPERAWHLQGADSNRGTSASWPCWPSSLGWPFFLPLLSCHPRTPLKEPRLPGQGRLAGGLQTPAAPCLATGDPGLLSSRKVWREKCREPSTQNSQAFNFSSKSANRTQIKSTTDSPESIHMSRFLFIQHNG